MNRISRREFLKLASTLPMLPLVGKFPTKKELQPEGLPNIIVILFDALSASNLSLYGYSRQTSPNLEQFASQATVYHAHHSAGNFTTPSTASLFTGAYPWTHRAFSLSGLISPQISPNNVFQLLGALYHQAVYAQNTFADMLLFQFEKFLDHHQGLDSFSLAGHTFYNNLFPNDAIYGMKSFDQFLFKREEAHGSLVMSIANDLGVLIKERTASETYAQIYPDGLPRLANTDVYFLFEQATQGVMELVSDLPNPFMLYLHFMPPHEPYTPTQKFINMFADNWSPESKKKHRLAPNVPEARLQERRRQYDQYVANVDFEFGRLLARLKSKGLMENSYVILSSDHGELFERGAHGHSTPLVFEPVINIPLVISSPGQQKRADVYTTTSNVDLLPTMLNIAGLSVPEACEGEILPGLGGVENQERSIYIVEAKKNPAFKPLTKATLALMRGNHKIVHYLGYKHYNDVYEFYDLSQDPHELVNLYPDHPASAEMKHELDEKRYEKDKLYR